VYLVLWGFGTPLNDPGGEIPYIESALSGYPGWHWLSTDTQYFQNIGGTQTNITNSTGQWVGDIIQDNTRALPPDNSSVTQSQWQDAIRAEGLAVSSGVDQSTNAIWVVATPPRTYEPEHIANACAWHGSTPITGGGYLKVVDLPYETGGPPWPPMASPPASSCSAAPFSFFGNLTYVVYHEILEAITDPILDKVQASWIETGAGCSGEIGELCGQYHAEKILPDFVTPNLISLAQVWSDAASSGSGSCVKSYTNDSYRFWVNSSGGVNGYLYTSLGGNGCSTSGAWWDGVTLKNNVAAVSWGPGRIDIFALDTNNHMQHLWTNDDGAHIWGQDDWGSGPSGWTFFGTPSVASWGPYHLDVFSLAQSGSSYALMHWMWNQNADNSITSTGWENWGTPTDSLGNSVISTGIGAVSEEPNRVDVFTMAQPTTGNPNLWQAQRNGSSGGPTWINHGNPGGSVYVLGTPAVASWGPGRWDLFVVDETSPSIHLRHWYYDAGCCSGWDDWGTLPVSGGMNSGGLSAIAMGENRLNIYAQAFSSPNNIYRRTWDFGDLGWSGSLGCSNPASLIFCPQGTR
jgi:hypothetical protein